MCLQKEGIMDLFISKYRNKLKEYNKKNKAKKQRNKLDIFCIVSLIIYLILFALALVFQIIFNNSMLGNNLVCISLPYVVVLAVIKKRDDKKNRVHQKDVFERELNIIKSVFEEDLACENGKRSIWSKELVENIILFCDKKINEKNRNHEMVKNYILLVGIPFLLVVFSEVFGRIKNEYLLFIWIFLFGVAIVFFLLFLSILEDYTYRREVYYKTIRDNLLEYTLTRDYFELDNSFNYFENDN
jgi:di/tricarboxylate transporter